MLYFTVTRLLTTKFFTKSLDNLQQSLRFNSLSSKFSMEGPFNRALVSRKLDLPELKSCITEEIKILDNLLRSKGHEIRIVGGAVRDILRGVTPDDLDIATTATPEEMKEIFSENNIRMINDNGEKHGTITPRINEKNFEITTLRIDVSTNGRHAKVQFTKDWYLDANRRDLTINAMFLGLDGTLYDYFNGIEDLKNHRIRFVGNPNERIQEDYLRILRYFRFYGKISEFPDKHDEDILNSIRGNGIGLEKISGERIWNELNKIIKGNFAGELILKIVELDLGPYIGFPEKCNVLEFKRIWNILKFNHRDFMPMTLLVSLFDSENDLKNFYNRIKPSRIEGDLGFFILENRQNKIHSNHDSIRSYQHMLIFSKLPTKLTRFYVSELIKYKGNTELLSKWQDWKVPNFPVKSHLLKDRGLEGKNLGLVLKQLKEIWYENEFNISKEKLLEQIPQIVSKELKVIKETKP